MSGTVPRHHRNPIPLHTEGSLSSGPEQLFYAFGPATVTSGHCNLHSRDSLFVVSRTRTGKTKRRFLMKRSTIGKTFTMAVIATLALALSSTAKASDKGCTNATLRGSYA